MLIVIKSRAKIVHVNLSNMRKKTSMREINIKHLIVYGECYGGNKLINSEETVVSCDKEQWYIKNK